MRAEDMQSQKLDQSGKASETVQLKRSRAKGTNRHVRRPVLPRLVGRQASVHGTLQSPCKMPLSIPLQVSGHQGHRSLLRTSGPSLLQGAKGTFKGTKVSLET